MIEWIPVKGTGTTYGRSKYRESIAKPKKISLQQAKDRKLFGPVWHGSTPEGREAIAKEAMTPPRG